MNVGRQTLLDLHQCQSGGRSYVWDTPRIGERHTISEDDIMDKDRVVGSAKQVKGAVKQVVGKAVGDAKLESEGKADEVEGKVQNVIGGLKDTLKGK
jgi:uncharacterized protein YjbJ (UPF0337 family)